MDLTIFLVLGLFVFSLFTALRVFLWLSVLSLLVLVKGLEALVRLVEKQAK